MTHGVRQMKKTHMFPIFPGKGLESANRRLSKNTKQEFQASSFSHLLDFFFCCAMLPFTRIRYHRNAAISNRQVLYNQDVLSKNIWKTTGFIQGPQYKFFQNKSQEIREIHNLRA